MFWVCVEETLKCGAIDRLMIFLMVCYINDEIWWYIIQYRANFDGIDEISWTWPPSHISASPPSVPRAHSPLTLSRPPEMVSLRCATARHSLLGPPTCLARPRRRACPVAVEAVSQAKVPLIRIGTRGRWSNSTLFCGFFGVMLCILEYGFWAAPLNLSRLLGGWHLPGIDDAGRIHTKYLMMFSSICIYGFILLHIWISSNWPLALIKINDGSLINRLICTVLGSTLDAVLFLCYSHTG